MVQTKDDRSYPSPDLVRIGYVSGLHGLRGAVRLKLDNPDSALLLSVRRVTLSRQGLSTEFQVTMARPAGQGTFKVSLDGITSVALARALRGAIVMVPVVLLPPTAPREFYYYEALGCDVVTTTGLPVGVIAEVFSNGANDVWVVRSSANEHLVPVIDDIVKEVDFSARRVVIQAVPGLLD
jgi:16S rRNA processing protein RimM